MANQLNYSVPLTSLNQQRPYRPTKKDQELSVESEKTILFGTHPKDNVEVWIYNSDGSIAGHVKLRPEDAALTLSTALDNETATEFLNLDLEKICERIALAPGRYSMVANFFRDEVGSLDGYKLYIEEISSDRTELRLRPVKITEETSKDIFEFVVPSVPRLYAKAIVDQVFGKSLDFVSGEDISSIETLINLNDVVPGIGNRIKYSDSVNSYNRLFINIKERMYVKIIDAIEADASDYNVQKLELMKYIDDALVAVLNDMILKKEIDPRFELV